MESSKGMNGLNSDYLKGFNKVIDARNVTCSMNTTAIGNFDCGAQSARSTTRSGGPWAFSHEAKAEMKHNLAMSKLS